MSIHSITDKRRLSTGQKDISMHRMLRLIVTKQRFRQITSSHSCLNSFIEGLCVLFELRSALVSQGVRRTYQEEFDESSMKEFMRLTEVFGNDEGEDAGGKPFVSPDRKSPAMRLENIGSGNFSLEDILCYVEHSTNLLFHHFYGAGKGNTVMQRVVIDEKELQDYLAKNIFCQDNYYVDQNLMMRRVSQDTPHGRSSTCYNKINKVPIFSWSHSSPLQVDKYSYRRIKHALQTSRFDAFETSKLSTSSPMLSFGYAIFEISGVFKYIRINPETLIAFLNTVDKKYLKNPYHQCLHAVDVAQMCLFMLKSARFIDVTPIEKFTVIFAALIHDLHHPGVTNMFLVKTGHELARLYNDMSPLENHHLYVAFQIIQDKECNIFEFFDPIDIKYVRHLAIEMIFGTSLSCHLELTENFNNAMRSARSLQWPDMDREQRGIIFSTLLHSADISNPLRPLQVYVKWVQRIMQEFFNQGDEERRLGIEISPMCCRTTTNIAVSQIGFINFLVAPVWETWRQYTSPDSDECYHTLKHNYSNLDKNPEYFNEVMSPENLKNVSEELI